MVFFNNLIIVFFCYVLFVCVYLYLYLYYIVSCYLNWNIFHACVKFLNQNLLDNHSFTGYKFLLNVGIVVQHDFYNVFHLNPAQCDIVPKHDKGDVYVPKSRNHNEVFLIFLSWL